jgi:hypothetical protein
MAKVTVKRAFPEMPNARVGQEVDVDDSIVERLERDGHIEPRAAGGERLTRPSGQQNQNQSGQGGDKPSTR